MAGFNDIKGQEGVVTHFKNAIKLNKISHAYILNGEKGMGKKTIARAFVMTVMCERGGDIPCMECHSCRQAMSDNHPDIRWVTHQKPNVISVEEIREQINGDVQIKPYNGGRKVYIVDEADKMNVSAQNALLKTIEEPPLYAIILLLTGNKETLLPTILSRCVSMELKPVHRDILEKYLKENVGVSAYKAREAAAFSGGNIGKAMRMADSEDFSELKDSALKLLKKAPVFNSMDIADGVKEIGSYKDDIEEYMSLILSWYRDLLVFKAGGDEAKLVFKENADVIKKQANSASYSGIDKVLKEIDRVRARLRLNVNFDAAFELLLLTMEDCFKAADGLYC